MPTASLSSIRQQIAAAAPDPIYLVQGEDELEKSALAAEFADLVEEGLRAFNVERLHAGDLTTADRLQTFVADLVAAVRTLPMMVPRRVVVVAQAESLLAPKRDSEAAQRALDQLEALVKSPEPTTTLVFVAGTLDKRGKMYKLLAKQATLVECGVLESVADAERWVRRRVGQAGSEIEPRAAQLLAERAGTDLKRLRAEVDRLLLFTLGQKAITVADARELAGPQSLVDEWALANAIEAGDAREGLRQIKLLFDAGAVPEVLLGQLGWVVRARLSQVAPARLTEAVDAVFRTDLDLKRSNRSTDQPRMLLERLVVELCGGKRQPAWSGRR